MSNFQYDFNIKSQEQHRKTPVYNCLYMGVSKNRGTPKSSILIGFSIVNHPFWGAPIFLKRPHIILFVELFLRFLTA